MDPSHCLDYLHLDLTKNESLEIRPDGEGIIFETRTSFSKLANHIIIWQASIPCNFPLWRLDLGGWQNVLGLETWDLPVHKLELPRRTFPMKRNTFSTCLELNIFNLRRQKKAEDQKRGWRGRWVYQQSYMSKSTEIKRYQSHRVCVR